MTARRPHGVFVRDIGPTFTFATAARAHERARLLVGPGLPRGEFVDRYAEVVVTDRNAFAHTVPLRTVYRHDRSPSVEEFDDRAVAWRPVSGDRPVTDDMLDAPDGAVVTFDDGINRQRIGDTWCPTNEEAR